MISIIAPTVSHRQFETGLLQQAATLSQAINCFITVNFQDLGIR
jgi:hypothetical protein